MSSQSDQNLNCAQFNPPTCHVHGFVPEEISVADSIVQPPYKSHTGELVLVKPCRGGGKCFWGILVDQLHPETDKWTCQPLTDQEFADHIRNELLDKERSRDWDTKKILAMHSERTTAG